MPETKDIRCGLYWKKPDEEEKVVTRCKTEWPVLNEVKGRRVEKKDTGSDQTDLFYDHTKEVKSPTHVLIEGDNYHTLAALNFTHKEGIDVIYIDPPYNTGNNDFIYNDRRIDKEDPWRHSSWLSFMHKRLFLARQLLKETGVMFISIDDNEQAQLRLLCDEVFGEENITTMIWEKTGHGKKGGVGKASAGRTFRSEHEYIIVCYKDITKASYNKILEKPNFKNEYSNPDNDPRGPYKAGNISASQKTQNMRSTKFFEITSPAGAKISRQWLLSKEEFELAEKDDRIYWGRKGTALPTIKIFTEEEREVIPGSIIKDKGSLAYGKDELEEILGIRIENFTPKPTPLIKYLLKIFSNKSSIILDFFAGSGTTGHAVLELNEEDGGNRQFILCTDNESKICTDICYPRISKVMKGYKMPNGKKVEGLEGSLKYYKVAFEKASNNGDQAAFNIAKSCRDILKEKVGIRNLSVGDMNEGKILFLGENKKLKEDER